MHPNKTAVERAFELARLGQLDTPTKIRNAIAREGYAKSQLDGPMLRRQLVDLIKQAKTTRSTETRIDQADSPMLVAGVPEPQV